MTLGKHFINDVDHPVERGLQCSLRLDQSLRLIESEKVLYRQQTKPKVILLVDRAMSQHMPVMLDICVAGQIFASLSASQMLTDLKALDAPMGILMIIKNYTGDKLNFELAAQKGKTEGIEVNTVFLGDDVSVKDNELVGRRGLAGVVFIHKCAGSLAATGATLQEVTDLAQSVADNVYTVGVSLDRCSVPQQNHQQILPAESPEYGMGIHIEPAVRRDTVPSLATTVENGISFLSSPIFNENIPVAVMINNLGGLNVLELNIVAGEVMNQLENKRLIINRLLVGTFVTSLDGPGFSVTILKLRSGFEDLLNRKMTAPAWPNLEIINQGSSNGILERTSQSRKVAATTMKETRLSVDTLLLQRVIKSLAEQVASEEPLITQYDTIAGDGDCGITLPNGANAIQSFSTQISSSIINLMTTFHSISTIVETSMGSTSGALYAIFFNALANSFSSLYTAHKPLSNSASNIRISRIMGDALPEALAELCRYTTARKGHRTLIDALIPFIETYIENLDFSATVVAARRGADITRKMYAVLGRASYVGKDNLQIEEAGMGVPDPGAVGLFSALQGIGRALRELSG